MVKWVTSCKRLEQCVEHGKPDKKYLLNKQPINQIKYLKYFSLQR